MNMDIRSLGTIGGADDGVLWGAGRPPLLGGRRGLAAEGSQQPGRPQAASWFVRVNRVD